MNLQHRIDLMVWLGEYMLSNNADWQYAKEKAGRENGWFTAEFIDLSIKNIAQNFLSRPQLLKWVEQYKIQDSTQPQKTGIVMAGNLPLVGFHDFLCVFTSGHHSIIKPSSKDEVLIKHLLEKCAGHAPEFSAYYEFRDMLRGCDAYIATGSNNTAGYFEYYFSKYPHIIRKNRTSVAILDGNETSEELDQLADDVFLYFGKGCRNVTKIFVPQDYDFIPLLNAFRKYDHLADHHKYKNNYDYNLALHLLNKQYYMSTPALLVIENSALFSPISQLNYEYYTNRDNVTAELEKNSGVQAIVGHGHLPFGKAQCPTLDTWADGINTLEFLSGL